MQTHIMHAWVNRWMDGYREIYNDYSEGHVGQIRDVTGCQDVMRRILKG